MMNFCGKTHRFHGQKSKSPKFIRLAQYARRITLCFAKHGIAQTEQ